MNDAYADAIGAPEIPNVTWDDIGGLSHLKEEILSSLLQPVLPNGLRRSGWHLNLRFFILKFKFKIFLFYILFRFTTSRATWNW